MKGAVNDLLGVGIYTVPEAACLTEVSTSRIRRWLKGYAFRTKSGRGQSPPVWKSQIESVEGTLALGFLDLMEIRVVEEFLKLGVTWKTIREAAVRGREIYRTTHPFCTQPFKTDGRSLFSYVQEKAGEPILADIVKNQRVFNRILEPFLCDVEYVDQTIARWWPMGQRRHVVLDPHRCFGKPIVAREGVPTQVLAQAFAVEQSIPAVARWYELSPQSVRSAVEFERRFAA